MRIGIDVRMWGPSAGGIGRYVEELVRHLAKAGSRHEFILFTGTSNVEAVRSAFPTAHVIKVRAHWYTLAEQVEMARRVKAANLSLMHFPHWNIPVFSKTPFVVTIHDLILLEEPRSARATTRDPLTFAIKRAAFHAVLHAAMHRAKRIVAVSNYTKESILSHMPSVPPERVTVVYEGVTDLSASGVGTLPGSLQGKKYFLYVGSAYPHKNLESLLHAFSFFHKLHPEILLVLAGRDDVFYGRLRKELEEIDVPSASVVFVKDPGDAYLRALYRGASLYLFPSRIEGFGLPPLEAMQEGVPVAAANRAALPEVLGDAAVYFDPQDIENMVEVMETALSDAGLRKELTRKGHVQAGKYSWETMARETLAVYDEALKA